MTENMIRATGAKMKRRVIIFQKSLQADLVVFIVRFTLVSPLISLKFNVAIYMMQFLIVNVCLKNF